MPGVVVAPGDFILKFFHHFALAAHRLGQSYASADPGLQILAGAVKSAYGDPRWVDVEGKG